ncbi:3-oxosteroid 1-dehydrogenase [compost metagenome]
MSKNNKADLNRRQILKGSIAGALLVGGGAALPRVGAKESDIKWDSVTDVICVGSGAAACSAAVTATNLGNKVTLIEKAPIFGGTTRRSGGVAWIPNNFSLKAAGIEDSEVDCIRYMARYAYPERYNAAIPTLGLDELEFQKLQALYRNASPAVDMLNELGIGNFIRFDLPGDRGPSPDYAYALEENKVPHGRSLWPDPKVDGGRGAALVDHSIAWLESKGATLLTEHRVQGLIMDNGRVVGAEVEHAGKVLRIRARKGVIFGSGGFAHNKELCHAYQPPVYGSCAAPTATGDFVKIASAVGACMGDLSSAWRTQVVLEEALQSPVMGRALNIPPGDAMILVNKYGRRVVNEKRNYNDRTRVHFEWDATNAEYPNQLLYMLFDQRAIDVYGGAYPFPQDVRENPYLISGNTIEELATNLQARLDSLKYKIGQVKLSERFAAEASATIKRFSEFARKGEDPDFNRGSQGEIAWLGYFSLPRKGQEHMLKDMANLTLYPFTEKGPYYALIVAPGALDTNAGPKINANAQVLDAHGKPIPGLYGAGNCVASPSHNAYFGAGGTVGPALTFGYIAAQSIHKIGA